MANVHNLTSVHASTSASATLPNVVYGCARRQAWWRNDDVDHTMRSPMHIPDARAQFKAPSLLLGFAGLVLALTACAPQDAPADELNGEENAEEPREAETASSDQEAEAQEPRDDLVDERVAEWDDYQEVSATELEIQFMAGNPNCYGVRAEIVETEQEVRIATISGMKPEAEDQVCTQELRATALVVTLDEELGGREVTALSEEDVELNS